MLFIWVIAAHLVLNILFPAGEITFEIEKIKNLYEADVG